MLPVDKLKPQPRGSKVKLALEVEWWPIDRPIPYLGNPRKLSDRAVSVVAASIKEFGWRAPICCDKKDVIVFGHTRRLAAKLLELDEVPVHVARNLSLAQCNALRLADNRTAEESDWVPELLRPQMKKLERMNFDLRITGFTDKELEELCKETYGIAAQLSENGAAPAAQSGPVARAGDVWLLGEHKLAVGGEQLPAVDALLEHWLYVTASAPSLKNGQLLADVKTARLEQH